MAEIHLEIRIQRDKTGDIVIMDIVCISRSTWEGNYMKSNVHLMGQLAAKHRVLYVDYVMTWKDLFTLIFAGQLDYALRILGVRKRLTNKEYNGNIIQHLIAFPVLPINFIGSSYLFDHRHQRWRHRCDKRPRCCCPSHWRRIPRWHRRC